MIFQPLRSNLVIFFGLDLQVLSKQDLTVEEAKKSSLVILFFALQMELLECFL